MIDIDQLPVPDWGLRCPACDEPLAGMPEHRCGRCGQRFNIRQLLGQQRPVPNLGLTCEECGYLLTGLTEDRCPECGTEFSIRDMLGPESPQSTRFRLHAVSIAIALLSGVVAVRGGYADAIRFEMPPAAAWGAAFLETVCGLLIAYAFGYVAYRVARHSNPMGNLFFCITMLGLAISFQFPSVPKYRRAQPPATSPAATASAPDRDSETGR